MLTMTTLVLAKPQKMDFLRKEGVSAQQNEKTLVPHRAHNLYLFGIKQTTNFKSKHNEKIFLDTGRSSLNALNHCHHRMQKERQPKRPEQRKRIE